MTNIVGNEDKSRSVPGVYIAPMRISEAGNAKREEADDDNSPQQSTNSWPAPCGLTSNAPSSIAPGVPQPANLRSFSICQAKLLEIDIAD